MEHTSCAPSPEMGPARDTDRRTDGAFESSIKDIVPNRSRQLPNHTLT